MANVGPVMTKLCRGVHHNPVPHGLKEPQTLSRPPSGAQSPVQHFRDRHETDNQGVAVDVALVACRERVVFPKKRQHVGVHDSTGHLLPPVLARCFNHARNASNSSSLRQRLLPMPSRSSKSACKGTPCSLAKVSMVLARLNPLGIGGCKGRAGFFGLSCFDIGALLSWKSLDKVYPNERRSAIHSRRRPLTVCARFAVINPI